MKLSQNWMQEELNKALHIYTQKPVNPWIKDFDGFFATTNLPPSLIDGDIEEPNLIHLDSPFS